MGKSKYRIVRECRRKFDTGKVECRFVVQYLELKNSFLKGNHYVWKNLEVEKYCSQGSFQGEVYFGSEEQAKDYVKNLCEPVPENTIINM